MRDRDSRLHQSRRGANSIWTQARYALQVTGDSQTMPAIWISGFAKYTISEDAKAFLVCAQLPTESYSLSLIFPRDLTYRETHTTSTLPALIMQYRESFAPIVS